MKDKLVHIRGAKWRILVLSSEDFSEKHGEDCVAITIKEDHEIHFKADTLTLKVVRHELFHAYCDGLYINSANLSVTQYEEIIAEFLEDYLPKMHYQATRIYKLIR